MSEAVGLVTGSAPFAGLPTNPAELVLPFVDGAVFSGIRVTTVVMPVSLTKLRRLIPQLVAQHRPRFVMSLGLALAAPVVRVEAVSVNATHFAVPDADGALPTGGKPIDPKAPDGRATTWKAAPIVEAILAEEVPATLSFHAGTHLCNLTLFSFLGALEAAGSSAPCGFLHLPYLPEEVAWLIGRPRNDGRRAPLASTDVASMALETQVKAVRAAIAELARQAAAIPARRQTRNVKETSVHVVPGDA
jgi:pyroglutamyl-peptidase